MSIDVKSAEIKEQEDPVEGEPDDTFESQLFSTHDEQGQTVNNYDIKIKNNIHNNVIHNLTLS